MKFYFTRHGESQANVLNMISNRGLPHTLTPDGRKQARHLADKLMNRSITLLFSSSLPRAMETASIVGQQLGLEPVAVPALREFDCGVYEGRSDEAAWRSWRHIFDAWCIHQRFDESLEGGETFHDVYHRFISFIQGLVDQYGSTEAHILCISHGGIYSLMLPQIVRNVDRNLIELVGIDYTTCIVAEVSSGSLTCVEWNGHTMTGDQQDQINSLKNLSYGTADRKTSS